MGDKGGRGRGGGVPACLAHELDCLHEEGRGGDGAHSQARRGVAAVVLVVADEDDLRVSGFYSFSNTRLAAVVLVVADEDDLRVSGFYSFSNTRLAAVVLVVADEDDLRACGVLEARKRYARVACWKHGSGFCERF